MCSSACTVIQHVCCTNAVSVHNLESTCDTNVVKLFGSDKFLVFITYVSNILYLTVGLCNLIFNDGCV